MSKIAVVILNYNGKKYLKQFLPSLIEYSKEADIIIADNASTDDSIEWLRSQPSFFQIIELDQNYGFAEGYNQALSKVEASYYVLLNSDVEVTENWLVPLLEFMESNVDYGCCQPKILDFNKKDQFEYAGAAGGFLDNFGYPFCRGRVFDNVENDLGQYDDDLDIVWASGAAMFVRADVYDKLGGLDSDFFAHMEEIDFCLRMQNEGSKLKCIPNSTVFHVGGGTLAKSSPFKTYLNFRNGIYLLLKNVPLQSLVWKLPIRILLDWIAALKFGFSESPKHFFAVIKAHFHVTLNFFSTTKKRSHIKRNPLGSYSILIGHYLKGKKKYSEF